MTRPVRRISQLPGHGRGADARGGGFRRTWGVPVSAVTVMALAAGCSSVAADDSASSTIPTGAPTATAPALSSAVVLVSPGDPSLPARPDQPITVTVADGRLTQVQVRSKQGDLAGSLSADGTSWTSQPALLGFGAKYTVEAQAVDGAGVSTRTVTAVRVAQPEIVTPSIGMSDGAVAGIGMPVTVRLSEAVDDRAAVEKRLSVSTAPAVEGAWSWVNDREVHWRPQNYWAPGTQIQVEADLEGARLGREQWGGGAATAAYSIGSANIYRVNVDTRQMDVFIDGIKVRTLPITTGKAGFLTRNGVKVILSKERERRMRSETVSIPRNSSEGYDLTVDYAMRLTYSGEFIHAAPWSVRSQGRANVSHGCTGMSTANAQWLYERSKPGDVVEYAGSPRPMTAGNGYGDWNVSWEAWKAGSALA